MKIGPKTQEEKEMIIRQIQNLIITGEIHEKTITENANKLSISRYTLREYLPIAYQGVDTNPETQIKKVKDTRQFLIDTLLSDFKRNEDSIQRNLLSKNISSLLDSQEKSSMLLMQFQEQTKVEEPEIQTSSSNSGTIFFGMIEDATKWRKQERIKELEKEKTQEIVIS